MRLVAPSLLLGASWSGAGPTAFVRTVSASSVSSSVCSRVSAVSAMPGPRHFRRQRMGTRAIRTPLTRPYTVAAFAVVYSSPRPRAARLGDMSGSEPAPDVLETPHPLSPVAVRREGEAERRPRRRDGEPCHVSDRLVRVESGLCRFYGPGSAATPDARGRHLAGADGENGEHQVGDLDAERRADDLLANADGGERQPQHEGEEVEPDRAATQRLH